jgi:endoglycosylceramidase
MLLAGTLAAILLRATLSPWVATATSPPLAFIRTSAADRHFRDAGGRVRIFHGVNRVKKAFPWYFESESAFPHHGADRVAGMGLNIVRLGWMWSGFAPAPRVYNMTYANIVKRTVRALNAKGVYVLLDMHQDVLSSEFCLYDGMPRWVVAKSTPRHAFPWPLKGNCSSRGWMINSLSEAAAQAYGDLYDNVGHDAATGATGMLDDLVAFWVNSAEFWKDEPGILGYELINEPFAGDFFKDPTILLPGNAGSKNLARMYDAISAAVRPRDPRHIVFFEPVTWGMVLNGKIVGSGFSHVPGGDEFKNASALSFHYYCATFVPDYPSKPNLRKTVCDDVIGPLVFKAVQEDVRSMGGAAIMTEGLSCGPGAAMEECVAVAQHLDTGLFSWTDYDLSQGEVWDPGREVEMLWARVYARATAGMPLNTTFDHATRAFTFCFAPDPLVQGPTEIFVGSQFNYPQGATIDCGTGSLLTCAPARIPPAGAGNASAVDTVFVTMDRGGGGGGGGKEEEEKESEGFAPQCITITAETKTSSKAVKGTMKETAATRAAMALDGLLAGFWSDKDQYLLTNLNSNSTSNSFASVADTKLLPFWNFAEAIHAVAVGASKINSQRYGGVLQHMIDGQVAQGGKQEGTGKDGWSRTFLDDMNWAVLALVAAYDATQNASHLATAQSIFQNKIQPGWDTTLCGGGVFWDTRHSQKATASNAGPAMAAAMLAARMSSSQSQRKQELLLWAEQTYAFWNASMTNPTSGYVTDHWLIVDGLNGTECVPVEWSFTYNEGLMLGAATVLGHARDAARFARRIVEAETRNGGVLFDTCEQSCGCCDCQSFKGVAIRALARWLRSPLAASSAPAVVAGATRTVNASATAVWNLARVDKSKGVGPLFSASWSAPGPTTRREDSEHMPCRLNAAAQTSAIFALMAAAEL